MKFNRLLITWGIFVVFWSLVTDHWSLAYAQNDWADYQKSGHQGPKWDEFVKAGFTAFDGGNLGSAEMFLQRAIARGCDDGLAYAKIGLFYEAQGNYKKALDYFQKAAKKLSLQYPNHELTKSMNEIMGRVLYIFGQKDKAESYLKKAIENKENFTALYFLGQYAREKDELKDAITLLERALKAERPQGVLPNIDILIMIEIGKANFELKKFDESLSWWNKILTLDPYNQTALSYKSNIDRQKYKEKERKVLEGITK